MISYLSVFLQFLLAVLVLLQRSDCCFFGLPSPSLQPEYRLPVSFQLFTLIRTRLRKPIYGFPCQRTTMFGSYPLLIPRGVRQSLFRPYHPLVTNQQGQGSLLGYGRGSVSHSFCKNKREALSFGRGSRHETLTESPVPVVEESPHEAMDESQDQTLEELPKELLARFQGCFRLPEQVIQSVQPHPSANRLHGSNRQPHTRRSKMSCGLPQRQANYNPLDWNFCRSSNKPAVWQPLPHVASKSAAVFYNIGVEMPKPIFVLP